MKKIISGVSCALIMSAALITLSWAQESELSAEYEIYAPRYPDRLCPPEHPSTRADLEGYMRSRFALELQQRYGAVAPHSMAQIEVLNDLEDEAACRHFSELFDSIINTQTRLFDGEEAEYWYDVTFYKGGDFYFVINSGGFFVMEDPRSPGGKTLSKWGHVGYPVRVYRRQDFEHVPPPK